MTSLLTHSFEFRTPEDIASIMHWLIESFPYLKGSEIAISELMINAVEHGNLGITYKEKSALLKTDTVYDEIQRRLALEKYASRKASIEIKENAKQTSIFICDEGDGFAWESYLDKDLANVKGLHGRGISLTLGFCKTLTYLGNGNKVEAVFDRSAI